MAATLLYRELDANHIIDTAILLETRIGERFPHAGLCKVGAALVSLARDTKTHAEELAAPLWWLRALIALVTVLGTLVFIFIGTIISFDQPANSGWNFVQGIEASINTIVFGGLGLIALMRTEERLKGGKVLKGLHRLRSLIHVIDMHQLTKDPIAFSRGFTPTASSPAREMSPADLERYLDYCSEMLSLTGKLAALYAQTVNYSSVVEAVNDIENLATNLSRKIWQKITMIEPGKPAEKARRRLSAAATQGRPAKRRSR